VIWPFVKVGDVAEFIRNGLSINQSDSKEGLPITRIETIADKEINLERCGYAGINRGDSDEYLLNKGDILISHINSEKHLAKCAIFELEDIDLIHGMNLLCLRPAFGRVFPKYLFYCLSDDIFLRQIKKITKKSVNQASFTVPSFKELEIPLPPLEEQKRIAAILDKADAIRRKRQQAIKLADDFLRSVFLEMFGDPVTNPKGWPVGTIRDLVETANYGSSAKASSTEGEYPMLRMGNITYEGAIDLADLKYVDLDENDKPKYLASKGDLLFNRTNSKELVGKTAVYDLDNPVAIAGYLIRVRTNSMGNTYYISGYLNSFHGKTTLQNMCKSIVGMANINAQEMQNIPIVLPPMEVQEKYKQIVVSTREKLKALDLSLEQISSLFNSLSQKAFSGNL
jgi:type I restriction enzyme S subunit